MEVTTTAATPAAPPAAPDSTSAAAAPAGIPSDEQALANAVKLLRAGREEETPATPAADAAATAETPPAETPPDPAKVEPAPGAELARIAAQKAEHAAQLQKFEADRAAWAAQQKDVLARVEAFERAQAMFERDPAAFVKALGVKRSFVEIARDIFQAENEEALTPEQKQIRAIRREAEEAKRRVEELERRNAEAATQQMLAGYRAQLAGDLGTLGDETPLLKAKATKRPQVVLDAMMQLAEDLARTRPDLGILGAKDLATYLEAALAEDVGDYEPYFETKFKPKAPPAPVTTPAKPPTTITTQHVSATPPNPTDLSDEERLEAAKRLLRAARANA